MNEANYIEFAALAFIVNDDEKLRVATDWLLKARGCLVGNDMVDKVKSRALMTEVIDRAFEIKIGEIRKADLPADVIEKIERDFESTQRLALASLQEMLAVPS